MFAYAGAYWDVWTANASLNQMIGEDAKYLAYKVVADDVDPDETTLGGRSSLGWDAIAITNNCENLDAALAFVDYCASQELSLIHILCGKISSQDKRKSDFCSQCLRGRTGKSQRFPCFEQPLWKRSGPGGFF